MLRTSISLRNEVREFVYSRHRQPVNCAVRLTLSYDTSFLRPVSGPLMGLADRDFRLTTSGGQTAAAGAD